MPLTLMLCLLAGASVARCSERSVEVSITEESLELPVESGAEASRRRLTALRAPYSWWDGEFARSTREAGFRSPGWYSVNLQQWLHQDSSYGHLLELRLSEWWFGWELSHTTLRAGSALDDELWQLRTGPVLNFPWDHVALSGGLNIVALEERGVLGEDIGIEGHAEAQIWALWPVSVQARLGHTFLARGRSVTDLRAGVGVQLYRSVNLHVGWREQRSEGSFLEGHQQGVTVGLEWSIGSFLTPFASPGPEGREGLLGWLF